MRRIRAAVVVSVAGLLPALLLAGPAGAHPGRPGGGPGGGQGGGQGGGPDRASVTRDAFGIPHIRASTRHDLYFQQGWTHAEDRLFQMDSRRREASGTLAELLGPAALPSDVQLRTIGLRRAAERSLAILRPQTRANLASYADGVNAWVRAHRLPPEYGALRLTRFEPWTPVDSIVLAKAIAFGLSFDIDVDPTVMLASWQAAGQAAGFDGTKLFFEDLMRSQPFTPAATVPDATGRPPAGSATRSTAGPAAGSRTAAAPGGVGGAAVARAVRAAGAGEDGGALADAARLARAYLDRAERVPMLARALGHGPLPGSNEWAVSGRHTVDGRALVANDPHLALESPSTFYPVHLRLRGGPTDVIGSGFAGVPGVVLGHNRHISWGATTNPMDVTDTYLEQVRPMPGSPSGLGTVFAGRLEPVQAIPEVFRTNNPGSGRSDDITVVPPGGAIPPATLIVPRRNNGPIIQLDDANGIALSVQYTGFSATRETETFEIWNDARGLEDFRAGLDRFDVGGQNWAYGDTAGNIAYFTSAELPLREDLQAGRVDGLPPFFIRDGTGGNEWLPVRDPQPHQAVPYEILPAEEMPHTVNPARGFFVNANNDPAGTTLDNDPLNQLRPGGGILYLNPGYDQFRGGRITQLLTARLARGRVSAADMAKIQADVGLVDAQFFVPQLKRAFDNARGSANPALARLAADPGVAAAVGRLAGWDFTTPTGIREGYDAADVAGHRRPPSRAEVRASVAATIYSVWRSRVVRDVVDARLTPLGVPLPDGDRALNGIKHLLETFGTSAGVGASGVDFFATPEPGSPGQRRDLLLLRALSGALAELASPAFAPAFAGSTDQDDYRWGRLHWVRFRHRLGGDFDTPPAFGAFPRPVADLPGVPTDGGFGTVDAASHNVRARDADDFAFGGGPANRYVSVSGRGTVRAWTSLPGGLSGVPGSRFYVRPLLPLWLTNENVPLY